MLIKEIFIAIGVGGHKAGFFGGLAICMHRAGHPPLKYRLVNLPHLAHCAVAFDSHNDPVGMEEVFNRGTFAEKLRVRDHVVLQLIGAVQSEMAAQLASGLHRHGALFDDQPVATRALGNAACHPFNGGQVGFAVIERRRAHTNEDGLAAIDGIFGGAKLETSGGAVTSDHLVQKGLEKGQVALAQALQLLRITLTAKNLVAQLCQTRSRSQPDVACTDYRDFHVCHPAFDMVIFRLTGGNLYCFPRYLG
jgi:hypothetical protein